MFERLFKAIQSFLISAQQARAATTLARSGKWAEAQALYKD